MAIMQSSFSILVKTLLYLLVFLLLSVFTFYIPGCLLIEKIKKKLRSDEKITLSYSIGIVLFLILACVAGLAKLRFLSPLILVLINLYALKKSGRRFLSPFRQISKEKFLILLLLFCTLVEGFINFPSGFTYPSGHLYWSSQGHDGLWHVAVIEAIKKQFPPNNPLYSGGKLYNYHYFTDVIMAEFGRIFPFFSTLDLYFRFFSFLISFLIGLSAYSLLVTWKKSRSIGLIGIFFTYLVGSFGYLVLLIQKRGFFGGETIFWAAQSNTIIGNPPHAFCYFLLPAFFLVFHYFLEKKSDFFSLLACFLLGGFLVGFKVSAAFILLTGLGLTAVWFFLTRKNKKIILLTLLLGFSNLLIFKLITKKGELFLLFLPWWFIRTMIVVPDRVNWIDLELRRQFYLDRGGWRSVLRIIQFETTAFLIYLFGNLGMRFIGFLEITRAFLKKSIFKNPLESSLFLTMLTGFIMPIFFVQRGVAYNLIQFMQYFLLFFGFWAAASFHSVLSLFKNKAIKVVLWGILISLSVPTVIGNLKEFYGKNALARVSNQEIEALKYMQKNSTDQDIILTYPFNPYSHGQYPHQPWPIYAWESTAYVSAYTGRQTYCTNDGQLRILAIDPEPKLEMMKAFFSEKTTLETKQDFLQKEKITYLYLRNEELTADLEKTLSRLNLKQVFKNDDAVIFHFGS